MMFAKRSEELEIMDDLSKSDPVVFQTLRELKVINKRLGGNQLTLEALKRLLRKKPSDHGPVTIADLGCGAGDMMVEMVHWCKKQGHDVKITGIDANPWIVDYATKNTADHSEINYQILDVFSEEFKKLKFDIITCTLFTHHFKNDQLIQLFSHLKNQARFGIIINDLHRHWLAYHSIKLLTSLFSRSYMVKNDAPLSVARSFLKKDWQSIFNTANVTNYTIRWKWAFRWMIIVESGFDPALSTTSGQAHEV